MATSDGALTKYPADENGLKILREALESDDLRIEVSWAYVLGEGETQQARLSIRDADTKRWRKVDLPPLMASGPTRSDLLRMLADVLDAPFSWLVGHDGPASETLERIRSREELDS